jgi:hypothetical protein
MAELELPTLGRDVPPVCHHCRQRIRASASCDRERLDDFVDGDSRLRIRYGDERQPRRPRRALCADCGVEPGGFHHPGCGNEECPGCRRRALACDCVRRSSRRNVSARADLARRGLARLGLCGAMVQVLRERALEAIDTIDTIDTIAKPFTAAGLAEQLNTPQDVLEVVLVELVEVGWLERTLLPLDGCNGGNCSHSNGVIFWAGGLVVLC